MTLRVWGDPYYESQNLNIAKRQAFSVPTNCLLKAVKPSLIIYGNPTITAMSAKIYSSSLDVLIATSSNTQSKAAITTLNNAFKQIWFEFTPAIELRAGDFYFLVINWTGAYTYSGNSHVAWAHDFPQLINPTGHTPLMNDIPKMPYAVEFFTTELY